MKQIRPYSKKRGKQVREYRKIHLEYLRENPLCERCNSPSHEIHHKKSRRGNLLTDTKFFMSCCRKCHIWIHENVTEAKKLGYLINSLIL